MATLVIVLVFSPTRARADDGGWKLAEVAPPRRCATCTCPWWPRHLGRVGVVALFAALVLIPIFFSRASESFLWTRVLVFAIAGCSLTILTGWAGQLSLGQFGFAAVGGLTTVKLVGDEGVLGLHDLPWGVAVGDRRARGRGGRGAHRAARAAHPGALPRGHHAGVRGVRLGVAGRAGRRSSTPAVCCPTLDKPDAGIVDFSSRRSYYYLCLAFLARVRRDRRPAPPHRHRPLGDRGARQPGVGRGHDHLDDAR